MLRIGRPSTAAERLLRMAVEQPLLLDEMARNAYAVVCGLRGDARMSGWSALPTADRERWCEHVLARLRDMIGPDCQPSPAPPAPGTPQLGLLK
jgi:hypothetical protein